MKIIEGKPAELRSYQTEEKCLSPKYMECVSAEKVCIGVQKPIEIVSQEASVVEVQKPIEIVLQEASVVEVKKPIEIVSQGASDVEVQKLAEHTSIKVSAAETKSPVACTPQKLANDEIQVPQEYKVPNMPVKKMQALSGVSPRVEQATAWPLQATAAQVMPVPSGLGQAWDEAKENMSERKRKQWLAETILHMAEMK